MSTSTKTLHFYTTGDAFTPLVRGFIEDGSFKTAYDVLKDGGANEEMIKAFFEMKMEFIGDTRDESFAITPCESTVDINSMLFVGIKTALADYIYRDKIDRYYALFDLPKLAKKIPNIEYLFKVFTWEEIIDRLYIRMLNDAGYDVILKATLDRGPENGVILPNGAMVLCQYMDHINLYPYLFKLGFADNSNWTDDTKCIHVGSGQTHGKAMWGLDYVGSNHMKSSITDAQIQMLFDLREHIRNGYGEYEATVNKIREYIVDKEDNGGKYGNLAFLKRFYPKIKLPQFGRILEGEKVFLRTSPRYSLPGLLNSRLIDNTTIPYASAVREIVEEFEQVKKLRDGNRLHWFSQEFLEGANGVAHYYRKGEFEYNLSNNQGDIVKGVKSDGFLMNEQYNTLRSIAAELSSDLDKLIQLEFVVHNEEIYIVQLRVLENNPEETVMNGYPNKDYFEVIKQGLTFSRGNIEVDVKDILIIDSEADSKELLGKKALIVKQDPSFSHILALSKALRIPSIYAVGDIDLTGIEKVQFTAYNKEAFICKILKEA